jgi:hypothetical protein
MEPPPERPIIFHNTVLVAIQNWTAELHVCCDDDDWRGELHPFVFQMSHREDIRINGDHLFKFH